MNAPTIRELRNAAIIADARMRDLGSERDWHLACVVAAFVFGLVALCSFIAGPDVDVIRGALGQ